MVLLTVEGELAFCPFSLHADSDNLSRKDIAEENTLGKRIFDIALNRATQRTSAQNRIETAICKQLARLVGDLKLHILSLHTLGKVGDHQIHDLLDLLLVERREDNDLVHTVEELGAEVLLESFMRE